MALSQTFFTGSNNAPASPSTTQAIELFNKLGTGEVISAFRRDSIMMDMPWRTRAITNGKSAQMRVTSRTSAGGHSRGDWILEDTDTSGADYLKNPKVAEVVIGLDRALVSGAFFDELDDVMSPDAEAIRTETAFQFGEAIARQYDFRRMCNLVQGALASTGYNTDLEGGTSVEEANVFSTADDTMSAFIELAQTFDEKFVPKEGRYAVVSPADYHWMVRNLRDDVINVDYRGEGSVARAEVVMVQGFKLLKSTNLPTTNVTGQDPASDTAISPINDYNVDARNLRVLAFHPEALGVVHPGGLAGADPVFQSKQYDDRLGMALWAKAYSGSKYLRSEACGLIRTAIPS
jgi:hypothetical protein